MARLPFCGLNDLLAMDPGRMMSFLQLWFRPRKCSDPAFYTDIAEMLQNKKSTFQKNFFSIILERVTGLTVPTYNVQLTAQSSYFPKSKNTFPHKETLLLAYS